MSLHGLSGNLLMATGAIHCTVGLLILRDPLVRTLMEGTLEVTDMNDRYQRECAFWFQFGGIAMGLLGGLLRHYCVETKTLPPKWFGWSLTTVSGLGVLIMPVSGFWLVLGQGIYIIWSNEKDRTIKNSKSN